MHQLPLDQYFLKCDSFAHYLTLYITENFKIHDYLDVDENDGLIKSTASELELIRKLWENLKFIVQIISNKTSF